MYVFKHTLTWIQPRFPQSSACEISNLPPPCSTNYNLQQSYKTPPPLLPPTPSTTVGPLPSTFPTPNYKVGGPCFIPPSLPGPFTWKTLKTSSAVWGFFYSHTPQICNASKNDQYINSLCAGFCYPTTFSKFQKSLTIFFLSCSLKAGKSAVCDAQRPASHCII